MILPDHVSRHIPSLPTMLDDIDILNLDKICVSEVRLKWG
jgi:hypothetical protein